MEDYRIRPRKPTDSAVGVCQKERYERALKMARNIHRFSSDPGEIKRMEQLFPELKEADGEESKRFVLEYLHDGLRKTDEQFRPQFMSAIEWLEKIPVAGESKELTMMTAEESLGISSKEWNSIVNDLIFGTAEENAKARKDAYNDALDKIEYHSGDPTFDDGWYAAMWYIKTKHLFPWFKETDGQPSKK